MEEQGRERGGRGGRNNMGVEGDVHGRMCVGGREEK